MSHNAVAFGNPSDAVAMVKEQQALQQKPDVAPVVDQQPVEVAPPVAMEAPKDFAVVVSFGAKTEINDNPALIPKLETADLPNVSQFLAAHADKTPAAITRTGDTYIINMGDGNLIKARTGHLEEAVHNGVIKGDSKLLAALKMTELTTSADLPTKAQKVIQKLATSAPTAKVPDPFKKAQDSAIFAAYVEKFAKITVAVDARVAKAYGGNADVTQKWADFKTAYTQATEDGDYETAFNALNSFTAAVGALEKDSDSPWLKPQLPEKDALPPSNIITMANLAHVKLKAAVENSGKEIADPKNADKTITAPTLTEKDKAAIADPRAFLASIGNDWNHARRLYRLGELTHPGAGMQALLDFRKTVVEDILRQVKVETKAHVIARKVELNKTLPEGEKIPETAKDLGWSAAGSTDATSDIDTSLSGEGTEWAAKRFNELFSKAWGRDSGIVFDVNVYARDFVPQLDKMAFHKTSKDALPADVQAAAETTISWDTDIRGTAFVPQWEAHQESQALYSTRSHMSKAEWTTYKTQMLDAVKQLPIQTRGLETERLNKVFTAVETTFRTHNDDVAKQALAMVNAERAKTQQPPLAKLPHFDNELPHATQHALEDLFKPDKAKAETVALAAENRIYHQCLDKNEGMREKRLVAETKLTSLEGKLKGAQEELAAARLNDPSKVGTATAKVNKLTLEVTQQKKTVQRLTFELKVAISESLNYANETYATEGALLHTVGNKQMLSKGPYADKGSKPRLGKIKLTEQQWTQAFREQIGMSFKELTRRDTMGDSLIQGGKYIHRALNAAKHVQKMTGMPIQGPPSLDFLRFLAKETVGTKKDGSVIDRDKGETAIQNLKDWVIANPDQGLTLDDVSDQAKMRAVLMKFSGEVEKTYQKWVAAGRPEPHQDAVQLVQNPHVNIPASSYRATKKRASADDQVRMVDSVLGRQAMKKGVDGQEAPVVPTVVKAPKKLAALKVAVVKVQKQETTMDLLAVPQTVKRVMVKKMPTQLKLAVDNVDRATARLKEVAGVATMNPIQLRSQLVVVRTKIRELEVREAANPTRFYPSDADELQHLRAMKGAIETRLNKLKL